LAINIDINVNNKYSKLMLILLKTTRDPKDV